MKNYSKSLFFLLLVIFIFSGCKKDTTGITSSFYFTANINGQNIVYEDGKNGYGCGAGYSSGTTADGCELEQSLNLLKGLAPVSRAGVSIVKTFPNCGFNCDQIQAMFGIGSYNFGKRSKGSSEYGIDGAVIYYVDSNGVLWRSDNGAATQTDDSYFEIVEHIDNNVDNNNDYSLKISKAYFECILYDDAGNSLLLTDGEIRSRSVTCGY